MLYKVVFDDAYEYQMHRIESVTGVLPYGSLDESTLTIVHGHGDERKTASEGR